MKKKLLWMLFLVCLAFILMPTTQKASASQMSTLTTLHIGSINVTLPSEDGKYVYGYNTNQAAGEVASASSVDSNATWWVYKSAGDYTLTLKSANITSADETEPTIRCGIYAEGNLSLVGQGNNIIGNTTALTNLSGASCGIYVNGNLTVSGTGSLTVNAGHASDGYASYGVYSNAVNMNGCELTVQSTTDSNAYAFYSGVTYGGLYAGGGYSVRAGSSDTTNSIIDNPNDTTYTGNQYVKISPPIPTVSQLGASSGPRTGGSSFYITGSNFIGVSSVQFGSTPANFIVISDTQISVGTPEGLPGDVYVTVTNASGTSATDSSNKYTYLDYPVKNTRTGTSYGTLWAARDAASAGDTLQLTTDCDINLSLILSKNLTLDLNGYTITAHNTIVFDVSNSTLTVKDDSAAKNGKITSNSNSISIIYLGPNGNLTLMSGTLERAGSSPNVITNNATGTVSISGGTVRNTGLNGNAICNEGTGAVNISGGTVQNTGANGRAVYNKSTGSITISGGLVEDSGSGIAIKNALSSGSISIDPSATITGLIDPATATPVATVTSVLKTAENQTNAAFTLTNTTTYTTGIGWVVYDAATGGNVVSGVTASNEGNLLTLTHGTTGLSATDYYVAAYDRAHGKGVSGRLKLTVVDPDTTAPTISAVVTSPTTVTTGSVTVTVTATDTNGIATANGYSFDGGTNWQTANAMSYTANTTIDSGQIQVKDTAGNIATYNSAVAISNIDTTAPTISSVSASPTAVTTGSVTVTVTATDTNGIAATNGYSFDGGTSWQTASTKTYSENTTIAANSIQVKDTLGNTATYPTAVTISNIDTTAPTISTVSASPTTATSGSVTVTVTATDSNGIAATSGYSFDGGTSWQTENTKTYSANTTITANSIKVKDTLGNTATYPTAVTISNIDTTAPTISSVSASPTTATTGSVTITVTATDISGIAATNGYSFDGGNTWQTANAKSYTANATIASDKIQVKDSAGNIATYSAEIIISNIDTTAPTISVVSASPTTATTGIVTVTVIATDANGIAAANGYSFDGGTSWQTENTKTYSENTTIAANSIKVKDTLGNTATYPTVITISNIDTTAPTISSVSTSPTTATTGNVTVTVTATDGTGAGITAANGYSFDGGTSWQTENTRTYSENTTIAANSIKVKDTLGNIATYPTAVTISNIDTTAPTISSVIASPTSATTGSVTITITATDTSGIAATNGYSFDGGSTWQTANTKSYAANTTIASGSIKVKDTAGNIATYNSIVTISNISIGNSGNGGNNTNSGTVDNTKTKTEGKVEKDQKLEAGAPVASLANNSDELKANVFTPAELAKVAEGENAKIILKVTNISSTVSSEDKQKIEEKLDKDTTAIYLDLSLYKQVGNGTESRVTETASKIKITIEVPQELWNKDTENTRTYRVVRVHDGISEILEGTYDPATHLFTFETDRFSTYALTYQDAVSGTTNNTTNDSTSNTTNTTGNIDTTTIKTYNDFYHLRLSAKAAQTSQTLTFAKVKGAEGYLIYGAGIKEGDKLKKLAEVKADITTYTQKKLKKATYYQYQVKAYKVVNGKKVVIATSKVIYSVTESKTYGNPMKVTSDTKAIILTVGKAGKITCTVMMPEGTKLKTLAAQLRYESTNKKVATVSSSGKVSAVAKGTCYVYAYAQNGSYQKIKVTVQ